MSAETPEAISAAVPQLYLNGTATSPARLLAELWSTRELCITLARKDFFVRYRRALFGLLWAVALPAVQAAVLAVVLTRVARISVPHYSVFIFSGIVGWSFFTVSLSAGATAIVDNSSLSSRIYFPRAVLPLAACFSNVFSLLITIVVLLILGLIAGAAPGLHTLYVIPAAVLLVVFTAALTLVLAALHVYFRDVKYAVQAALLVWFYVTPIFYPLSLMHGWVYKLVLVNPATGFVTLFQAGGVGVTPRLAPIVSALVWTTVLSAVALVVHCRRDRLFADLL